MYRAKIPAAHMQRLCSTSLPYLSGHSAEEAFVAGVVGLHVTVKCLPARAWCHLKVRASVSGPSTSAAPHSLLRMQPPCSYHLALPNHLKIMLCSCSTVNARCGCCAAPQHRQRVGGPPEGVSTVRGVAAAAVPPGRGVSRGDLPRCSATIFSSCRATRLSQRATCASFRANLITPE